MILAIFAIFVIAVLAFGMILDWWWWWRGGLW